jgi:hypothetical protein
MVWNIRLDWLHHVMDTIMHHMFEWRIESCMIGKCMWVGDFNKIKNIPNFQAYDVVTLVLGSWPRQGLAKVRTKSETQ